MTQDDVTDLSATPGGENDDDPVYPPLIVLIALISLLVTTFVCGLVVVFTDGDSVPLAPPTPSPSTTVSGD